MALRLVVAVLALFGFASSLTPPGSIPVLSLETLLFDLRHDQLDDFARAAGNVGAFALTGVPKR